MSASLTIRGQDEVIVISPEQSFVVGRGADADLVASDQRVSWRHLLIEPTADGWAAVDISSSGTWLAGRRMRRVLVRAESEFRLGASDGPRVTLTPGAASDTVPIRRRSNGRPVPRQPPEAGGPGRLHELRERRTSIGRALSNDIVVGDLLVSRNHAVVLVDGDGVRIADLGSANGTFVNGRRIHRARLHQGDAVAIGHHVFHVVSAGRNVAAQLVEHLDSGDVMFEVDGLCVDVGRTRLLQDVTFRLPGRALLAVIGPSGAGKSTLLNALTGFRPADAGTVRYAGRDLYAEYDELRRRIGYVPQDDILHSTLTVRQALGYAARLRFPAETTQRERQTRIDAVLAELGLTTTTDDTYGTDDTYDPDDGTDDGASDPARFPGGGGVANLTVAKLSGGQRKRTSVALELLTQPTLLYLDEPTSGLDPGLDQEVMEALRRLADDGRTVVVATHSVAQLDLCDYVLVLARGGQVAYFGAPQHALWFLRQTNWSGAFRALTSPAGAASLARRYRSSGFFVPGSAAVPASRSEPAPFPSIRQQSVLSQLFTLSRRYLRIIAADPSYLRMLVTYPVVLGLIPRVVETPHGLRAAPSGEPNRDAIRALLVVILMACFVGMSNTVRELVKERAVYRRERAIGLSTTAYLGSKVLVQTFITTVQSIVITVIAMAGRAPADGVLTDHPMVELTVAVAATAVASAMIGLAVSALVDNADKTLPPLVVFAVAQLVLSGPLVPLVGRPGLEQLAWIFPSRWGYAATASVTDLITVQRIGVEHLNPGIPADPLWRHTATTYLVDLAAVGGIGLVSVVVAALLLRRLDPPVVRSGR